MSDLQIHLNGNRTVPTLLAQDSTIPIARPPACVEYLSGVG